MDLPKSTAALKAVLDAMPGTVGAPMTASRGTRPLVMIYKVMGRTFAILSLRDEAFVMLKCDPARIDILKEIYRGIGHRTHLDPRHWISVELDADVPAEEIRVLAARSRELVVATLTRKQQQDLETLF